MVALGMLALALASIRSDPSGAQKREPVPHGQDTMPGPALSPAEAIKKMTVPEGFSVSLFAGEPDVCQPIALCLDDRGRLWVAEAYSYPVRRADWRT